MMSDFVRNALIIIRQVTSLTYITINNGLEAKPSRHKIDNNPNNTDFAAMYGIM